MAVKEKVSKKKIAQNKIDQFLAGGGSHPKEVIQVDTDYRMTLRIPKNLLHKIDEKRLERSGRVSRTLWIIEQIEKGVGL